VAPQDLAAIAVLVRGLAARTGAAHVAVWQEHLCLFVVGLPHRAARNMTCLSQFLVELGGQPAVFRRMRRMKLIEADQEAGVIAPMFGGHGRDQLLGCLALLLGTDHDRRAVGIFGADVEAVVAAHLLEAHPDIGLHCFDDVAEVQWPVGVRQGAGNEDFPGHDAQELCGCGNYCT
jgi:hypothetical protein